jgi:hypothetical protein
MRSAAAPGARGRSDSTVGSGERATRRSAGAAGARAKRGGSQDEPRRAMRAASLWHGQRRGHRQDEEERGERGPRGGRSGMGAGQARARGQRAHEARVAAVGAGDDFEVGSRLCVGAPGKRIRGAGADVARSQRGDQHHKGAEAGEPCETAARHEAEILARGAACGPRTVHVGDEDAATAALTSANARAIVRASLRVVVCAAACVTATNVTGSPGHSCAARARSALTRWPRRG